MLTFQPSLRALLVAFLLFVGSMPQAYGQQCISQLGGTTIGGSRQPGSDGKLHFKYRFRDANGTVMTPPAEFQQAMEKAAANWNAAATGWNAQTMGGATGVVFEPAGPNDYADILVVPSSDPNHSNGCAGMDTTFDYLYYDPTLVRAAATNVDNAATVLAHELGHFLGLEDAFSNTPNPPTVMNNPRPTDTCENFSVPTTKPLAADGAKVAQCVQQARNQTAAQSTTSYFSNDYYTPTCYSTYLVTDHWVSYDGGATWSYMGSTYQYMGSTCMLTQ